MKRRTSAALLLTIALILTAAFSGRAQAQTQTITQYRIQLNTDGSATWVITQISGSNGSVDTWAGFEGKVTSLINAASNQTNRQMGVDDSTIQMSTVFSNNSKSTAYSFTWLNFSVTKNGQLVASDVFGVNDFFDRLYGDGTLQINYPPNYILRKVIPTPDQQDPSTQTLDWLGTQSFVTGNPKIEIKYEGTAQSDYTRLSPYILVSVTAVAVVAGSVATWLFFVNRRQKIKATPLSPTLTLPETEEEKVLRLLRSNSNGVYQSTITEECKFSKAKTSQLLTALEHEGKVRRVKKGRDKIVNIVEQTKARKNAG